MTEPIQERTTIAVERFLEDEALTENLTDVQAKPLLQWLTQEANAVAIDTALSDQEVNERLSAFKSAVLAACQKAGEASTGESLIEAAKQALLASKPPTKDKAGEALKESEAHVFSIEQEKVEKIQPDPGALPTPEEKV